MSKDNEKQKIHSKNRSNIIKFPKPSTPSGSGGKKDVESGARYTINFEPDWDTDDDDPKNSSS